MTNLTIGLVTEGPTDRMLIKDLISNKLFPGKHRYLILQPEESETIGFGTYGGGWKGVLGWCSALTRDFNQLATYFDKITPKLDILIIHIDADVAREEEINCAMPCPPAKDTCNTLTKQIMTWLGNPKHHEKLVICIPSDNMEAWILAAFDPQTPYHHPPRKTLECVQKPDIIISAQNYQNPYRLLKRKDGKPKKTIRSYQLLIPTILER